MTTTLGPPADVGALARPVVVEPDLPTRPGPSAIDHLVAAALPHRGRLSAIELAALVTGLAHRPDLWRHLVRHDPERRWYARLHRSAAVEVWLLGWHPGQTTDLHDHGSSSGAFTVTEGELRELHGSLERWRGGRWRTRRPGPVVSFGPGYVHDLVRRGDGPATSLHAYSPPLRTMTTYRLDGRRLVPHGGGWTAGPEPAAGELAG